MEMILSARKVIRVAVEGAVSESDDHSQDAASHQEEESGDHHQHHNPSPALLRMQLL
jgi:hypothetical protein